MPPLRPTPPQLDAYDRTFPTPNARPAIQPGIRLHPGRALRVVTYAASARGETPGETANWERAIAGSSAPQCSRGQNSLSFLRTRSSAAAQIPATTEPPRRKSVG